MKIPAHLCLPLCLVVNLSHAQDLPKGIDAHLTLELAAPAGPAEPTRISLAQAIAIAERAGGGRAMRAELLCEARTCNYQVVVARDGGATQLQIDAEDGRVMSPAVEVTHLQAAPLAPTAVQTRPILAAASPNDAGRWHELGPHITIKPSVSIEASSGQVAGMYNVILHPKAKLELQADIKSVDFPQWHTNIQLAGLYGSAQTGNGNISSKLQELRGRVDSLYEFYNADGISHAAVGLYAEFAEPLHRYEPYLPSVPQIVYAAEEEDLTTHEFLWGADFKFSLTYDRLKSDLHNIIFFHGNRIAPNLLSYNPLLGFMWHNQFALTGNPTHPGLSLLTDAEFYFARKAGVPILNLHDGLGGTKREIFLSYGLSCSTSPYTTYTLRSYGYNNLNRGDSTYVPISFRDGFTLGVKHEF